MTSTQVVQYGPDHGRVAAALRLAFELVMAHDCAVHHHRNGVDVELSTPVGRYTLDKQITGAIVPMLTAVGIRTKLLTPEWATLWANVQVGKVPFYYMGRGGVVDPIAALSQYFETGGSPRIGISDPRIDQTLAAERVTFDPAARKKALNAAFKAIEDAAPACFMWRHHILYGEGRGIEHAPTPSGRIFGTDITVKQ